MTWSFQDIERQLKAAEVSITEAIRENLKRGRAGKGLIKDLQRVEKALRILKGDPNEPE